jgi:hypothetical protein
MLNWLPRTVTELETLDAQAAADIVPRIAAAQANGAVVISVPAAEKLLVWRGRPARARCDWDSMEKHGLTPA